MDINTIPWQYIAHLTLLTICSLTVLAIIAFPIMGIVGQILSLMRQRTAYAKCAKQITQLTLILGWIVTLFSLIPLWMRLSPPMLSFIQAQENNVQGLPFNEYLQPIYTSVYLQMHLYTFALLLAATLFITFFYALWSKWKEHRILIQSLALVSSCWYATAVYCIFCVFHADSLVAQGMKLPETLNAFLSPSMDATFWKAIPYLLPLSFALAAGLACVWLLMRRSRDDFGRDYYAQMLVWCAKWARNSWFLFWTILLVLVGVQWADLLKQENYLTNTEFIRSVAFMFMWLIPGILWTIAIKSAHPLRHKITLVLAFIFSVCSIIPIYLTL